MEDTKPGGFYLRSTSTVSLHERFSQVVEDQQGHRSMMRTRDPGMLQQRRRCGDPKVLLLLKRERSWPLHLQTRDPSVMVMRCLRRRSVWTRLGWWRGNRRLLAFRPRGFWSFINKYRRRTSSTYRGPGVLHGRLSQRLLRTRNIQKLTSGRTHLQRGGATATKGRGLTKDHVPTKKQLDGRTHLQRGGATATKGRGLTKDHVPTKKQLDAQLDEYMSMSKRRLDKELDNYMSMSKSRLDTQLDEYMAMAGQTLWD